MSDEPTQDLTAVEMLRLVLADVREMKTRLGAVEGGLAELKATVDDRLKDTRPIWQSINKRTEQIEERMGRLEARADETNVRLSSVEKELASINEHFETFSIDHMKMRSDIRGLKTRLTELEERPN